MSKYHVQVNAVDFGVIEADSEQEARDAAAQMAGYASEADMAARLGQLSELVAAEVDDNEGDDGANLDEDSVYTYTIFDADPAASGGTAWPTHTDEELEAASDEEAIAEVRRIMRSEAKGLSPDDGYSVGDYLYALIWSADGTQIRQVTHELTADDLGEYIAYESEES